MKVSLRTEIRVHLNFSHFVQALYYSIVHRVCCILLVLSQKQQKNTQHKRHMHALVQHKFFSLSKCAINCNNFFVLVNIADKCEWIYYSEPFRNVRARELKEICFRGHSFAKAFFVISIFRIFDVVCWWSTARPIIQLLGFQRRQIIYCDLFSFVHNSSLFLFS